MHNLTILQSTDTVNDAVLKKNVSLFDYNNQPVAKCLLYFLSTAGLQIIV